MEWSGKKMSMNIGPFEILSELAKSPTGSVYKANDPETGQTIALKAIRLSAFGESATALEQALLAEAESTKVLSSPNLTSVYGAGEIEGQFCAAMDYIQGNSIATMLARKEGFSIWDLLDIGRQLTSGLDHAAAHNVVHYSLEPGKIMCGWDGTVKILSFGVSVVGNFVQHIPEGVPASLYYMSPEQILGQPMDERSNLFSLGAMFYEMVTERKAFDREDAESLRQCILGATPVAPAQVNPKVHPLLSDLIMKALAKDPTERYQTGRALLDDLEKCKESKPLAAKKPDAPKGAAVTGQVKAAAQSKFVAAAAAKPAAPASGLTKSAVKTSAPSGLARPSGVAAPASRPAEVKPTLAKPADRKTEVAPAASTESWRSTLAQPSSKLAAPKAAAAAAGAGSSDAAQVSGEEVDLDLSGVASPGMPATQSPEAPSAYMSSAVADEPQVEPFEPQAEEAPKIKVDPMMAEGGQSGASGTSFSDLTELPPLKEVYIAPPPPPPAPGFEPAAGAPATPTVFRGSLKRDEKPKVQPREVAEKAIEEIKNVPPKLMLYALGAAGALIIAIGIGVTIYIHNLGSDDDAGAGRTTTAAEAPAQPEASQPAPQPASQPAPKAAEPPAAAAQPEQTAQPEVPAAQPVASARSARGRKKAPPPAPMIIPGQLAVDSTPQGAQVQIDGRTEPAWLTPFAFSNLQPGQHSITVSKPGYSTDTRSVMGISGNKVTVIAHLSQLMATLVVKSDPPGANIYVDGRDVGAKTPAQVSVDKGQHVVLVRMMGYIDETMNGQFALGQTFSFAPTLRPLGNADSIKTVGKMSKLFGGKGVQPGQGVVSIHTQPKGAQVAINQHILEKNSPLDVALDPGNYVIDITLTGYAPVHKIVTAEKGGKVVVDEVLQAQ